MRTISEWDDALMTCYKRKSDDDFGEEDGEDFDGDDDDDDDVKSQYPFFFDNIQLFQFTLSDQSFKSTGRDRKAVWVN